MGPAPQGLCGPGGAGGDPRRAEGGATPVRGAGEGLFRAISWQYRRGYGPRALGGTEFSTFLAVGHGSEKR